MLLFFVVVIVVSFCLWCKDAPKKVKKKFICYCFLIFFFVLGARALVRSLWSRSRSCGCVPVLVVVAPVLVFGGAALVVVALALVAAALVLVFRLWVHPVLFC